MIKYTYMYLYDNTYCVHLQQLMCTQQIPLQRRGRSRQKRGVIHVVTVGVGDQYFQEMELVRLVDYYIRIYIYTYTIYIHRNIWVYFWDKLMIRGLLLGF